MSKFSKLHSANAEVPLRSLPAHPRLEWLKNEAKKRLRETAPLEAIALAEVQHRLAREYGFPSWRALKGYIEALSDAPVILLAGDDLCSAANRKDIVRVRQLLTQRESPSQAQLDLALARGICAGGRPDPTGLRFAIGDLLLEAGANPNGEYGGGYGPIVFAVCEGLDAQALEYLLTHGAKVDFPLIQTKYGPQSPITHAMFTYVRGRNVERHQMLELLVQNGAVYQDDAFFAISCGNVEKLDWFLDKTPELISRRFGHLTGIGQPDLAGATLLHYALEFGEEECADLLLDRGADWNLPADSLAGQTPVFHAIRSWRGAHYRMLRHFLERSASEIDWSYQALLSPEEGVPPRALTPVEYAGCARREVRLMERFGVPVPPTTTLRTPVSSEQVEAFNQRCVAGELDAAHKMLHEHPGLIHDYPLDWIARRCVWHRPYMIELAQMMIEHGATAELPVLARCGLLDEVIRELEDEPSMLNQRDERGRSALYRAACIYGSFPQGEAVVEALMSRGAEIDIWTACTLGLLETVRELLAREPALANAADAHGMAPLHWACRHRRHREQAHEIVRLLCEAGANVEAVNPMEEGMRPLHHCGEWASTPEVVDVLLTFGAEINALADNGWTPLDYAIDRGRHAMAAFLSERGAVRSPEQDEAGRVFLKMITDAPLGEIPEALRQMVREAPLLPQTAGPHPLWRGTVHPLHLAIETGHRLLFDWLLECGADPDQNGDGYDGWTPLLLALYHRQKEMAAELLARQVKVNLPAALMLGDDERVEQLLSTSPAILDQPMPSLASPLRFATTPQAAQWLVERGASLEKRDRYGKTPLEAIASRGPGENLPVLRWLIERGVVTPPWVYAALGDLPRFQAAAEWEPSLRHDAKSAFAAIEAGQTSIVRWMLQQGLPPDSRSVDGSRGTLLHAAAWEGNLGLVQYLIECGASPDALDEEYRATPAQWATTALQRRGRTACRKVAQWFAERSSGSSTSR